MRVLTDRRRADGVFRTVDGRPRSSRLAKDGAPRRSGTLAHPSMGRQRDGVVSTVDRRDGGLSRTWVTAGGPRPLPGANRSSGRRDGLGPQRGWGASRAPRRPGESTNATVVALRPPSRRRRQRRLAAVGLGLALLGAGVAAVAVAVASSRKLEQVLGAYAGGWVAVMGGLKLLRGSPTSRPGGRARARPRRPSGRSVDDGAA